MKFSRSRRVPCRYNQMPQIGGTHHVWLTSCVVAVVGNNCLMLVFAITTFCLACARRRRRSLTLETTADWMRVHVQRRQIMLTQISGAFGSSSFGERMQARGMRPFTSEGRLPDLEQPSRYKVQRNMLVAVSTMRVSSNSPVVSKSGSGPLKNVLLFL